MATAKVIKGATRMVEKTVLVEESLPDKVLLELTRDEADILSFIVGQRYGDSDVISTQSIYSALASKVTQKLSKDYKIIGHLEGWKIVPKLKADC